MATAIESVMATGEKEVVAVFQHLSVEDVTSMWARDLRKFGYEVLVREVPWRYEGEQY